MELRFEKAAWPASHKKAYFILDELPIPFASVEAAFDSVIKQPHRLINKQPVLDMRQLKNKSGDVWPYLLLIIPLTNLKLQPDINEFRVRGLPLVCRFHAINLLKIAVKLKSSC